MSLGARASGRVWGAMFQHILVATDFAPASNDALDLAIRLAGEQKASLTILHVCEVPAFAYSGLGFAPADLLSPVAEAAASRLDELVVATRARFPAAKGICKMGVPHEQILQVAAEVGCDLLVLGTHGRRGMAHVALGSVAEKVVRLCRIPVLTVHAREG